MMDLKVEFGKLLDSLHEWVYRDEPFENWVPPFLARHAPKNKSLGTHPSELNSFARYNTLLILSPTHDRIDFDPSGTEFAMECRITSVPSYSPDEFKQRWESHV